MKIRFSQQGFPFPDTQEIEMLTRYTMTPEEVQEWMDARTKANPVIPACG